MPRAPRENGLIVGEQLRAIRKALNWKKATEPKNPLVQLYIRLVKTNPKEVAQQLERLEKEHRARAKAAPAAPAAIAPTAEKVPDPAASRAEYEAGDGYDRSADRVTPQVLGMIDRWLAGCKQRAEAGLPSSVPLEESDDE